jgi:putative methionine-R-sulfoxide reductase with GAF domain
MSSRSLPGLALALGGAASLEAAFVALAGVVAEEDRDARLAYLTVDPRADLLRTRWIVLDGRVESASMELSLGQLPVATERAIREAGAFADLRDEPAAYARLLGVTPLTADGTLAVRGLAVDGGMHGVLVLWEPRRVFGVRAVERLEPAVALFGLAVAKHAALLARDEAEQSVETIVERVHAEVMNRAASTERAQAELQEALRQAGRRVAVAESHAAVTAHHLDQAEVELHRRGESLRARTRTLSLLERLLGVAGETRDPAALIDGLLALLGDDLEAARCSLFLVGPASETLYLAAGRGLPPDVALGRVVPFGEGVAGQVAVRREPLLVTDAVDAKAQLQTNDAYRTAGSFISFPLVWRGALRGVVNVGNRVQQGAFTEEDVARVRLLGLVVAAIVVENDLARALWRGEAPPQ